MRSTEDKLIHIPLNVGMNQAVSPRLAPTGTLTSVQNCRTPGNGVLEQRPGTTALTGTTNGQATGHSLQNDGGATTNIELPSFACQAQAALMVGITYGDAFALSTVWQFQGRFSTCLPVKKRYGIASDDTTAADGFGITPPDVIVTASGYVCVAAITTLGVLHIYVEDANGVRIYYLSDNSGFVRVRLTAIADTVYVTTQVGTALRTVILTITSGVVASGALLAVGTLTGAGSFWDVSNYNSANWFLVYHSAAAVVTIAKLDTTATVGTTQTFAVVATPKLTIWADSLTQQIWVGFYDNAIDVRFNVWDAGLVAVKASTTIKSAANLGPPMFGRYRTKSVNTLKQAFYCFGQVGGGGAGVATWCGFAFGSATAPSTPTAFWHIFPISKPDNFNRVWCSVQTGAANQLLTRSMLLRFIDLSVVGAFVTPPTIELCGPNMPLLSASSNAILGTAQWFAGSGGTGSASSFMPLPNFLQQFYATAQIIAFDVYEYTTAEQETHRATLPAGITTLVSGQPVEFFGQSMGAISNTLGSVPSVTFGAGASEIGFPNAPVVISIARSAGAGGLVAGTYSWRFTYEWIDQYGRRHQSAPSVAVSLLAVAGDAATIVVTSIDITQRQASNNGLRVFLKTYRTVAGGTEYHEEAPTQIAFKVATGRLTVTDVETDANISQSGFLYTDGGVLDDTLAPSCRFLCKSEDRVWFGGLWDANIIQCSKVIVPGEPIQCTDDFSFQVQLPAACTGLAYMDGSIVAFTYGSIFLVSGDGPNDQGNGAFAPPRCLTRSVGAIDYRSIVETNIGVMFQSNLGLYLLPRGFGPVQYVGAAVQDAMADANGGNPTIYGAISHSSRGNHVARFMYAQNGSLSSAQVLTYDLDSNEWFIDALPALCLEMGVYDSLRSTGVKGAAFMLSDLSTGASSTPVFVENETAVNDLSGTVSIVQAIETAWIHPFGLGGWGKVNAVMIAFEPQTVGGATLTLTIETDNNNFQTGSWVISEFAQAVYRMLVVGDNRACSAIQIFAQMTPASEAIAGGFKFISITLEVEPSNGIRLLADAEKN